MDRVTAEELLRQRRAQLYPLNRLGDDVLERLLPAMLIEPCPAGSSLYDAGESPSDNFYVLQGCVCLYDSDGTPQLRIYPEPRNEATPLPYDLPSHERAVVTEDAVILRIERTLVAQALERRGAFALPGAAVAGRVAAEPADPARHAPAVAAAPQPAAPPAATATRVLLVEHRPVEAERTRGLVKAMGRRSDWARSAEEAVELLRLEHYGVVLLDLQLPDGDALDVAACIRALPADLPRPRVIAVTDAAHYDPEGCVAAGMDDAACLPLSAEVLQAKIGAAPVSP